MEESNNKGIFFFFNVLYIIEWIVVSIILLNKKKNLSIKLPMADHPTLLILA